MRYAVRYRDETNRRVFVCSASDHRRACIFERYRTAELVKEAFQHDYNEVEIVEFEPDVIPLA